MWSESFLKISAHPANGTIVRLLPMVVALALLPPSVPANSISYTGTLSSPNDVVEKTFSLALVATISLQTWGFGGGINAAGTAISAGGTDPFLGIFSGTGSNASILTDGTGNPYGTSLDLSNYGNPGFLGCPPAGAPIINGAPQCGDIEMTLPLLGAGVYTVVLTDGQYIPNAVYDNGTLGEGFTDLTAGAFCNIDINGATCPDPLGGAYAFDITGLPGNSGTVTPEPTYGPIFLIIILVGLAFKGGARRDLGVS